MPTSDSSPQRARIALEDARVRLGAPPDVFGALLISGLLGHWSHDEGVDVEGVEHFRRFGTQWRPSLGERGARGDPFFRPIAPPGIKGGSQPTGTLTEMQFSPTPATWPERDTGWIAQFYVRPNRYYWPVPTALALIGPPSLRLEQPRSVPDADMPTYLFPDPDGALAMLMVIGNPDTSKLPFRRAEDIAYPVLDELAMRYDQPLPVAQAFVVGIPSGVLTVTYPKAPPLITIGAKDVVRPRVRHKELLDCAALYRESISSNNPFHQFLTLWKAYENACAVRGRWRRETKKPVVTIVAEVFPEMYAFQGFEGLTFDQAKQQLNRPYRVALAHGQVAGGRPRTAAVSQDLYEVAGQVPVIRHMARTTISNVEATLDSGGGDA